MSIIPVRRALISVSDKTDLLPFAEALQRAGVEIISTGGTAAALSAAGVKVVPIERVTGYPEMMDGRVKTLHPAVHGALLARRDVPTHVQAMKQHDIAPIDLVCVNLYPFERTILKPEVTPEEAIEHIDIGGPAMIRSAAKNHQFVAVVTSPSQYDRVISDLRANEGGTTLGLRRELAAAAFSRTAEYDAAISAFMAARHEQAFPDVLRLSYVRRGDLRYGENPHQEAAIYIDPASPEPSVVSASQLHGKPLSYNNVADASAALELVQELDELNPQRAGAVIVKHANPCGAAMADDLATAFDRAYEGDPLAAYGGILALSRTVDDSTARTICAGEKFLEVVIAPGFDVTAAGMLGERWKNVRLLAVSRLRQRGGQKLTFRSIPGGMLAQDRDVKPANPREWTHVAGPAPTPPVLADAAFVWTLAKHLKSNAVAIGCEGRLLGAGPGQVDRLTACRVAVEKSGDRIRPGKAVIIAASDAFFPFPDGPKLLIDAGVTCLVHPGGSRRDQETIDLCNARGVTCLLTGVRHFRH
jgi:phosphoribosylaminoimidazolecarboxamide formyltransferase/IMP cyclohydrolase